LPRLSSRGQAVSKKTGLQPNLLLSWQIPSDGSPRPGKPGLAMTVLATMLEKWTPLRPILVIPEFLP
jgi:hypothetical protein